MSSVRSSLYRSVYLFLRLSRNSFVGVQAERSQTHPMEYAQQLRQALVNVPDGAQLFTVKGNHFAYLSELKYILTSAMLSHSDAWLP